MVRILKLLIGNMKKIPKALKNHEIVGALYNNF